MKRKCWIAGAAFAALLVSWSGVAVAGKPFQGVVEEKKIEHTKAPMVGEQTEEGREITYYKPGMIKVVELPDSQVTIIRGDKEIVWTIDLKSKTYTEMTFEEIAQAQQRAMAQMQQARQQTMQQLQNLPADQRQMVEQMMQSQGGQAMMKMAEGKFRLSWKDAGESEKILGYDCKKYIGLLNDAPLMEVWVTDKYDLGETFITMLRAYGMIGGEAEVEPLHGLPLKLIFTMTMGPTSVRTENVALKIEEKEIPDSEFELPSGLTKTPSPLQEMLEEK